MTDELKSILNSTNSKDRIGCTKVPLGLLPPAAKAHTALALLDGVIKYGKANWREESVAASVYIDACLRHIDDWQNREGCATDSHVHHLGHAAACLFIIMDAEEQGNLIDDRPNVGQECSTLFEKLREVIVHLYEKAGVELPSTPSLTKFKSEQ